MNEEISEKRKITLFTPYYSSPEKSRQDEIDFCLEKNLKNKHISKIIVMVDDGAKPPVSSKKITIVNIENRPTYTLWLELTKKYSQHGISILGNSDIYFDDSILSIGLSLSSKKSFVVLSRHEANGKKATLHEKPHWSQDSWAICADATIPIGLLNSGKIPLGTPRCDNRIAYLFLQHGWKVLNPCQYVRSYHLHNSKYRNYNLKTDRSIMGPVAYVHPNVPIEQESDVWIDLWLERGSQIRSLTLNRSFSKESEKTFWERHDNALWMNSGRFITALGKSRNFYVWGAGLSGKRCLRLLKKASLHVHGVLDNDQTKHGSFIDGIPVVSPSTIFENDSLPQPFVLIASMYSVEIMQQLRFMGKCDEVDFVDMWTEHQTTLQDVNLSPLIGRLRVSIKIDNVREVRPVIDTSPIIVKEHFDHCGDHHFWQYPCATERQAYDNHISINTGANIDKGNKEVHTYLGLPWATYIDRKLPYLQELDDIAGQLSDLKSQCKELGYKLRVHTVCQHIHWRQISEWFNKLGVTNLHLSHCEHSIYNQVDLWPYRIHSWPLIAASVESQDTCFLLENLKSIDKRNYLVSFVGAHMPHYRSDIRLNLQKEFQLKKKADVFFELRDEWHFNKVVYDEQAKGEKLDNELRVKQFNEMKSYNRMISDTVYSLCPEGAGPNTLRIWESLALGAIPVIITDSWVPPVVVGCRLQLKDCCIFVKSNEIDGLLKRLREENQEILPKMQNNGQYLYDVFKNYRAFAVTQHLGKH